MKAIVAVKPSPREPRRLLAHCYRTHGRGGNEVSSPDRVVEIVGNVEGVITRSARIDAQSLISNHHGKGRWLRHVVLSAEDCSDQEQRTVCFERLKKMVEDFVATFAPGATYLAVLHRDRLHPHAHVLVCNSVNGRTIDWQPSTLRRMQDMGWTVHAAPGRGSGQGKAVDVYPLSKNLTASKVAALNQQQLRELITAGTIKIARVNARGQVTSITYDNKRIRLTTIQRLALGQPNHRNQFVDISPGLAAPRPGLQPRRRVRRRASRPVVAAPAPTRQPRRGAPPLPPVAQDQALGGHGRRPAQGEVPPPRHGGLQR